MKVFALMVLLSSTAFAGSFTKVDQGIATWSLSAKNKSGSIVLTRSSTGTEGRDLNIDEQIRISKVLGLFTSLGTIADESAAFENSDERSQEIVSNLIKNTMIVEMAKLNVEVKNVNINLVNLNCQENGYIKKQLNCSARYISLIDVDFK